MRRYETIFIIDPEVSDKGRDTIFDRLKDLILQHNGFLAMIDEWGNRKLTYDIKKKARGYYVRLDYCGTGTLVNEIERFFRIDDRILKYMTVLLDKDIDLDQIKEEIAQAEAEAKSKAEAQAMAQEMAQAPEAESTESSEESEAQNLDQNPEKPPADAEPESPDTTTSDENEEEQ